MRRTTGILFALALAMLASSPATASTLPRYEAQVVNPDFAGSRLVNTRDGSVLLAWGTDATIVRSEDGVTWRHALTPGSADLSQLASNSQGSVFVAVGAKGLLLRSVDAGRTWKAGKTGVDTDLLAIVNVAGSKTWIAAGAQGRILRSTDDGRTWFSVESQLAPTLRALFFDPVSRQVLIGGDEGLVGASRDDGASWQVTSISMPDPVSPVSGFHRFGKLLLARSALGRFLISEDDAESWDLLQASTQASFVDAAMDPVHGAILLAGHNGDLLRSTDLGSNWQGADLTIDGRKRFLTSLQHDARTGSLWATSPGLVARSRDGGRSWQAASANLRGELQAFVHDAARGHYHVVGAGGQIATSGESGSDWKYARQPMEYAVREMLSAPGGALLATSRLGDVIRSTDGGASWREVTPVYPNPNTPPDLRGLLLSPSGRALIAVGPPGAILRAPADGSSWKVNLWTDIEAERAYPWMLADHQRRLLLAVEARGAMLVSRDDGETWQHSFLPVLLPPGNVPYWHGTLKQSNGVLLVAGESGRAARSIDGAKTWTLVDTGTKENLYGSFADDATGMLYLMGANGTLLRSKDDGAHWDAVMTGSVQELRRMVREPRTNALLCYGARGTLLRSVDGDHWQAVVTGTEGVLRKFMMEPRTGSLLLSGGQGALLRSPDGKTWEKLDAHTARHFTSIAADDRSGDLIVAGDRIVRLVRQSPR